MTDRSTELASVIGAVAQQVFGEANAGLSSRSELRFGSKGARVVDLDKGVWSDHS